MVHCVSCAAFDIQSFRQAPYQTRGYKLALLQHSANESGCTVCRFLCDAASELASRLPPKGRGDAQWLHLRMSENYNHRHGASLCSQDCDPLRFNMMHILLSERNALFTSYKTADAAWEQEGIQCRVLADPNSAAYRSGDVRGVYRGRDRSSEHHYGALAERLVRCLQHPKCNRTISGKEIDALSAPLPTRCIEVGQRSVHLVHTAGDYGAYVALSHRWSSATARSRTTTDNLAQRTERISEDSFTKDVQDAIAVTRRLGIPYLWVDSLCIVQSGDGGQDWKVEAMMMSQYYQNAVLTIAAANISPHGFLNPPSAGFQDALVTLPFRDQDGVHKGCFYIHRRQGLLGASSDYATEVLAGELLGRGWVLQEWLLSRRIIHYTENQTFFECQSEEPTNDYNEAVRHQDLSRIRVSNSIAEGQELQSLHAKFPDNAFTKRGTWNRIVMAYSGMQLTRPQSDRIRALAGIAGEFRESIAVTSSTGLESAYVAGWWLQDIHMGLLWEQCNTGPLIASNCGAPTWSWAAWLNSVHWRQPETSLTNACEVLGVMTRDEVQSPDTRPKLDLDHRLYDVDNNFTCLALRGKTQLVLCGDNPTESDCEKLAGYTGIPAQLTSRWKGISAPDSPSEIIGWADIDVDPGSTTMQVGVGVLLAFQVCIDENAGGSWEFGSKGWTHNVDCVLFLTASASITEATGHRWTRAGVGRIFKKNFFQKAELQDIWLE